MSIADSLKVLVAKDNLIYVINANDRSIRQFTVSSPININNTIIIIRWNMPPLYMLTKGNYFSIIVGEIYLCWLHITLDFCTEQRSNG